MWRKRGIKKETLQKSYNIPMRFHLCPELNRRNKAFAVTNTVQYSVADGNKINKHFITTVDYLEAMESLGFITTEDKIQKLKNFYHTKPKEIKLLWNYFKTTQLKPKILGFSITPSYNKIEMTSGSGNATLCDITNIKNDLNFIYHLRKKRIHLIKSFCETTQGIEAMSYYDTYISIIEDIYKGLVTKGIDILYENTALASIFLVIYPINGSLLLKLCLQFPDKSVDFLKESIKKVLINFQISKRMIFTPYMEKPDLDSINDQNLFQEQKDYIDKSFYTPKYLMPLAYPVENVIYLTKVVNFLFEKLSYSGIHLNTEIIKTIDKSMRYVSRILRSYRKEKIKIGQRLANVFVASADVCVSLISIRSLSMKEGDASVQSSLGIIDESLSGPDKVISTIIDLIVKHKLYGMIEIANYFNKVDLDQVVHIYQTIRLLTNTLFYMLRETDVPDPEFFVTIESGSIMVSITEEIDGEVSYFIDMKNFLRAAGQ